MEARNRILEDWYGKIQRGEIKLPRFQRHEAWDWRRNASLFHVISQNLPLGITLVLEVGEKEQFISRYFESAPKTNGRVLEHLLDGQQRLTALWRILHNNYELHTYFIYIPEFDSIDFQKSDEADVYCRGRHYRKNGQKYPLWCDKPEECLKRGMIPSQLLRPVDIKEEIDNWLEEATEYRKPKDHSKLEEFFHWSKSISDKILKLRGIINNYNIPYLSLLSNTKKDVALDVFINMNTNSKPLSQYDIIVAEVESVKGQSLHDMVEELNKKYPYVQYYDSITRLILNTSALLQDKLPNQRGAWDMDKEKMLENWDTMTSTLNKMAKFINNEGIFDKNRLPTNAVLAVVAALYSHIPEKGDEMGKGELLLKKYLWSAFFTDRYENSAATNAYYDYLALKGVITEAKNPKSDKIYSIQDVPIFKSDDYPISDADELLTAGWPKRDTIRGRAVLAVACRLGGNDFATGQKIDRNNVDHRHYHHIFPDALLKEAEIESFLALNCALITDNTNLDIGRKDPLKYLKERYQWASGEIVNERLNSHLIPVKELANGGYESLEGEEKKEKVQKDFNAFLRKRADFIAFAAGKLVAGKSINFHEIISEIVDA